MTRDEIYKSSQLTSKKKSRKGLVAILIVIRLLYQVAIYGFGFYHYQTGRAQGYWVFEQQRNYNLVTEDWNEWRRTGNDITDPVLFINDNRVTVYHYSVASIQRLVRVSPEQAIYLNRLSHSFDIRDDNREGMKALKSLADDPTDSTYLGESKLRYHVNRDRMVVTVYHPDGTLKKQIIYRHDTDRDFTLEDDDD